MNAAWPALAEPAPRLLNAAWAHAGAQAMEPGSVGVLGAAQAGGAAVTPCRPDDAIERWLVLSWIGAHPDADDPLLVALWRLEESARATGLPTLVLRLAPLMGPRSPLLALLARSPRLFGRLGRALIQPVLESDVIAGLARWIDGSAEWDGWYEVCGPDPISVSELAELARSRSVGSVEAEPAWEPAPGVLRAQGLSEHHAWTLATGITPRSIATTANEAHP